MAIHEVIIAIGPYMSTLLDPFMPLIFCPSPLSASFSPFPHQIYSNREYSNTPNYGDIRPCMLEYSTLVAWERS